VRGKGSSQILLRALDGEDILLEEELQSLLGLGEKVRAAAAPVPALSGDARRRIWEAAVTGVPGPQREEGLGPRVPRLAWGIAAGLALAGVVALVLVLVFAGGPAGRVTEVARLQSVWGEVRVIGSGGVERAAREGEALADGDTLITTPGSRATVEFAAGSILRLDGDTEAAVREIEGSAGVELVHGRSYHRVVGGEPYTVISGEVSAAARGTAFAFDALEDTYRVMSLQSASRVEVGRDSASSWGEDVPEGKVFVYRRGRPPGEILDISRDDLDNEWIRWNRDLDAELGFPLGILTMLDQAEEVENQPPAETGEQAQPSGGEQPQQEKTEPSPSPQTEPQPQPTPAPAPQPAPQPVAQSLVLSAQAGEGAVSFTWTVEGYSGFQGFKLCRSETNPAPSYPGDWWKYVDGEGARSTSDTSVQAGHTYYYRLGIYNQGSILAYSNAVQVTVPGQPQELSVTMSATPADGKVKISWVVSGEGSYDGIKVCRSETNPNPSYPGEWIAYITSGSSYADTDVLSGHTYYYRVGIYKGGTIIKYSNSATATLP
jgi:ferric-dicitrate binding protein FerR (iron transport regulator)